MPVVYLFLSFILLMFGLAGAFAQSPCVFQAERAGQEAPDQQEPNIPEAMPDADIQRVVRVLGGLRINAYASKELHNACAARPNDRRIVYYDPDWLERYAHGERWIVIGVLAHEVGHLLYEHNPKDGRSSWEREYEADFFVGQSIANLDGTRDDAVKAVSSQPVEATKDYPSRAVRKAAVIEGYDLRASFDEAPPHVGDLPTVSFGITLGADLINYDVEGVSFSANIMDYQDGNPVTPDDVLKQSSSVAVRLGRDNDMMMFSAFRKSDRKVCAKNLYIQIRDGDDIQVGKVASKWGPGEYYGIRYGRKGDLYNVIGIRAGDFEFVFDPSAPRTGTNRNPATTVLESIGRGAKGIYVEDLGCKEPNDWAWTDVTAGLRWSLIDGLGVDQEARNLMIAALARGNLAALGDLRDGYQKTQSHNEKTLTAFAIAAAENPKRVYNIGRSVIGLPQI